MPDPNKYVLNFHGIGDNLRPVDPQEYRYWLTIDEFKSVVQYVAGRKEPPETAITFDDGNVSDFLIAAPLLQRFGLTARFFVLAGRLGQTGALSASQVRELSDQGFEIGSHGYDHLDWTLASEKTLRHEIIDSRRCLQDITGRAVSSLAVPFGRYDRRVLQLARHSQYARVFSSDGGRRLTTAWPTPRRSLQRGVELARVVDFMNADRALTHRLSNEARLRLKALLGRSPFEGKSAISS